MRVSDLKMAFMEKITHPNAGLRVRWNKKTEKWEVVNEDEMLLESSSDEGDMEK